MLNLYNQTGSFTAESNSIITLGAGSKIGANSINFSAINVTVPNGYAVKLTDTCIKTVRQWTSGGALKFEQDETMFISK